MSPVPPAKKPSSRSARASSQVAPPQKKPTTRRTARAVATTPQANSAEAPHTVSATPPAWPEPPKHAHPALATAPSTTAHPVLAPAQDEAPDVDDIRDWPEPVAAAFAAKPLHKPAKPPKLKKPKPVRDSFTMPKGEYQLIDLLKGRAAARQRHVKKSEILRAGIIALADMTDAQLFAALDAVPVIKTGRPRADHESD